MRWVVVQAGARDAYQVPLALEEAGLLEALVTDWYSPLDRAWFRALAHLLPGGARARLGRRFRDGVPSRRVEMSLGEMALNAVAGGRPGARDHRLGTRAGRLARRRGAGVFSFSYYAYAAFTAAAEGLPRAIHQVHPHPASVRRLLREEMELVPDCVGSMATEEEIRGDETRFRQLCAEPGLADVCLAASRYTASTLVENGVPAERIRVIPYGVDLDFFRPPPAPPEGPFRVLFVGQMAQRKGLRYLLEAWRRLALPGAELVLAGRGRLDRELLARYEGLFRAEVAVDAERLRELYRTSDVFCMPSLAEGFGLVYLESLACGTPVIGTPNTGAADLVREGREGFVVPLRDVEALAERLLWCHRHRAELREMRAEARRTAERHSWAAFRRSVAGVVRGLDPAGERPPEGLTG
ncbi:MAG TPA: glycosyltransferase family 4 protein [Longimicrobium sp.]|jgi:glycosyltransferase involved in cell wall biosynthesis